MPLTRAASPTAMMEAVRKRMLTLEMEVGFFAFRKLMWFEDAEEWQMLSNRSKFMREEATIS
jgi:hypothetical protein